MKRIRNKIMLPVYIMAALFIVFMILQAIFVNANLGRIQHIKTIYSSTFSKSVELKLGVVQVQQWLTDISATRASEGFDDGYEKAETYAKNVRAIITELKEDFRSGADQFRHRPGKCRGQ